MLVYDNGPIETAPGISRVQNVTLGLTAPGFGAFRAPGAAVGYACADDFGVTNPMRIDEVELFCYQNNSGTTSTITGVYLQFFAADPSAGAAPLGTGPKFSTNLLTSSSINVWSGIYRDLESLPGATNRPLMQVRVALPQPLQLTSGVYWLEVQLTGSLSSGPWLPPVTVAGQAVTGDAMQQDTVTGTWIAVPMQSGTAAQGLPFRFYGAGQNPGTITQIASGCGPATIRVAGALQVGGFLHIELGNTHAIPVIGFDLAATPTSYCGCTFVHNFPVTVWFATQHALALPMVPALGGLILGVQGADLSLSGGGTCLGAVDVTDGYSVRLGM
ncbi:MAG: hypothetical protein U1E73_06640 [Planctomycetota bacterium]